MKKRSKDPPIEWAEAAANVVLTVVAYGLDAVALALLGRRKDPRNKSR